MRTLKADTFRVFGRFNWLLVAKAMASNQAFFVIAAVHFCQTCLTSAGCRTRTVATSCKGLACVGMPHFKH